MLALELKSHTFTFIPTCQHRRIRFLNLTLNTKTRLDRGQSYLIPLTHKAHHRGVVVTHRPYPVEVHIRVERNIVVNRQRGTLRRQRFEIIVRDDKDKTFAPILRAALGKMPQ